MFHKINATNPASSPRLTPASLLLSIAILASAAAFVAIPAWQLVWKGAFLWHVSQPQSWQGAIEGFVLGILLLLGFRSRNRWLTMLLVLVPALLYLRRHAVDAPLLLDLALIEIVIGLGMLMRRQLGLPAPTQTLHYLQAFVAGFMTWSLLAWTASALDIGSIKALRWLTLILAIPALFGGHRPLVLFLWKQMRNADASTKSWAAALTAWTILLFARCKITTGYDALWYGLQGMHVLAPGDSVYESLGLVSPVHYYPKIYEMLLLPLSAAGDNAILSGISILILVLMLMASHLLMSQFVVPQSARWPTLALIATLPAVANTATQPKPDILATLFILLALLAAMRFIRSRSWPDAAWLLSCAAIACSAKLTAIPYAGMLLLGTLYAAWRQRASIAIAPCERPSFATMTFGITMIVVVFVVARTLILSGLPTIGPDPLFKLWHVLGFELREPAGTLVWAAAQNWNDVPLLLVDWFFRPQHMPHIVVSWMGNVWLWLTGIAVLAALLLPQKRSPVLPSSMIPVQVLMATGLILALGISYLVRGSDGNYFLYALLPAIIISASAAFRKLDAAPVALAVTLACLPAFAVFQAGYSFVSGSWTPGTRALDTNFTRSWKQMNQQNWGVLARAGLLDIARYLKSAPTLPRVVGLIDNGDIMFRLPARYEDLTMIGYSRPEYVNSATGLLHFMHAQKIGYLILPFSERDPGLPPGAPPLTKASSLIESMAGVRRIDDQRYYLLDFSQVSSAEWARVFEALAETHADANGKP